MFDLDGAMSTEQAMPMSASMASPPAGHLGRSCMLASSFFLGCAHCADAHNTHVQRSSDVLNLFGSLLDLVFRRSLRLKLNVVRRPFRGLLWLHEGRWPVGSTQMLNMEG